MSRMVSLVCRYHHCHSCQMLLLLMVVTVTVMRNIINTIVSINAVGVLSHQLRCETVLNLLLKLDLQLHRSFWHFWANAYVAEP